MTPARSSWAWSASSDWRFLLATNQNLNGVQAAGKLQPLFDRCDALDLSRDPRVDPIVISALARRASSPSSCASWSSRAHARAPPRSGVRPSSESRSRRTAAPGSKTADGRLRAPGFRRRRGLLRVTQIPAVPTPRKQTVRGAFHVPLPAQRVHRFVDLGEGVDPVPRGDRPVAPEELRSCRVFGRAQVERLLEQK